MSYPWSRTNPAPAASRRASSISRSSTFSKHGSALIDTRGTSDVHDDRVVYRPSVGFHGTETFNYTAANFEGKTVTGKITVTIKSGVGLGVDPTDSARTALDVFGTAGNDSIRLARDGTGVKVTLNGSVLGTFHPTGLVAAFGDGGNDTIDTRGLTARVALFGDTGADTLTGGDASDALIAGIADYATKGFTPLAGLFNGSASIGTYAHNDGVADTLFGKGGKDVFFAKVTGIGTFDLLPDRLTTEPVTAIG